MNSFISPNFSGPYAQNLMNAYQNQWDSRYAPVINYWTNLTIDNASPPELSFIGFIIGYPWPAAPFGTFTIGTFTLGDATSGDPTVGPFPFTGLPEEAFADATGVITTGGFLSSAVVTPTSALIPQKNYIQMLKAIAYLKWNGLTLETIDYVVHSFWPTYTINTTYGTGPIYDILITLTGHTGNDIPWELDAIFGLFETSVSITAIN